VERVAALIVVFLVVIVLDGVPPEPSTLTFWPTKTPRGT
jgi:hypothetical protein